MIGHPMASAVGCPAPQDMSSQGHELGTRTLVSPPQGPEHLLVGQRLPTASSRATTRKSALWSMLSPGGSGRWALSGVQGQSSG